MNVDYVLCTEIQHRIAQILQIILQFKQNYSCHVSSNTNVDILSCGHVTYPQNTSTISIPHRFGEYEIDEFNTRIFNYL